MPIGNRFRAGVKPPAAPAVGDIDGDGKLEIVFFTESGLAIAIDSQCP